MGTISLQRGEQARERRAQALDKFITTAEACDYLRYTGKHRLKSLYRFLERNGVKVTRRSARALLIQRKDLDEAIGAGR